MSKSKEPKGVWLIVDEWYDPQSIHGIAGKHSDLFREEEDTAPVLESLRSAGCDTAHAAYYVPAPSSRIPKTSRKKKGAKKNG